METNKNQTDEARESSAAIGIEGLPFRSEKVTAYKGAGERVHRSSEKALDDLTSSSLARDWLATRRVGDPTNFPFKELVDDATCNFEIYEKLLIFVRWRRANFLALGIKI